MHFIKVLNALFDDRYGGPQRRVINVGKSLMAKGIETVLLLPSRDGNAFLIAEKSGLKAIGIPFHRMPKLKKLLEVFSWILTLPKDILLISKVIKSQDISVVHVNGAFFLAPALAAKITRRPLIWHLNDTIVASRLAKLFGVIVKWWADEVIVAAEAVASHYGVSRHSYTVIYAPVDVNLIRPEPEKQGAVKGPMRVGLIANWNPLKGLEVFIQAAAVIKEQMAKDIEFVIAGSRLSSHADYAASIDRTIHQHGLDDSVQTLGFVHDVVQFLHSLDVLVLSSWSEACPMSVLEGMAAGLPVVATDVGGVRELLRPDYNDQAGYVVPAGESLQLAERVLELLKDQQLRHRMGACGRKAAEQRFSLQACTTAHLNVYRSALGRGK